MNSHDEQPCSGSYNQTEDFIMKIGLVVCGVILGVLASFIVLPTPVQAQNGTVTVEHAYAGSVNVGSRTVVGFACTPSHTGAPTADCYIASR
jgi:hypothetical protein